MDNKLIRASYRLTTNELRLIYCAISKMPKNEPIDHKTPYYVTKEDFIKLGVEPKNVAREIRSACSDLIKRTVIIETPIGDLETHWLHNVLHFKSETFERLKKQYPDAKNDEEFINALRLHNLLDSLPIIANSDDNIVARIVFHEDIIPYLSQLKSHFTQFMLSDVHGFSGAYSYRFYQWMMQFKSTGYCKISLADLRKMLVLENKYEAAKDLKKWVIEAACNEINGLSPYQVKHELIKTGRKFTHLELKFKPKKESKPTVKNPVSDPNTPDFFIDMTDSQRHLFANKMSEMPEMSKYSQGTESYQQFAVRIAEMLLQPEKFRELYPVLEKAGFK